MYFNLLWNELATLPEVETMRKRILLPELGGIRTAGREHPERKVDFQRQ